MLPIKIEITVGRTPLNEGSASRRDLYQTIHNTPAIFEPTIPASSLGDWNRLQSFHGAIVKRRDAILAKDPRLLLFCILV
jgi:hypothetical protein